VGLPTDLANMAGRQVETVGRQHDALGTKGWTSVGYGPSAGLLQHSCQPARAPPEGQPYTNRLKSPLPRLRVGNRRIGGSGGPDERAAPQVSAAIR
jgi:hypothetical protein